MFKIWGSGVELMPLTVKDARKRMNKRKILLRLLELPGWHRV